MRKKIWIILLLVIVVMLFWIIIFKEDSVRQEPADSFINLVLKNDYGYELKEIKTPNGNCFTYVLNRTGNIDNSLEDMVRVARGVSMYLENHPDCEVSNNNQIVLCVTDYRDIIQWYISNACMVKDETIHDKFDTLGIFFNDNNIFYNQNPDILSDIEYLYFSNGTYKKLFESSIEVCKSVKYIKLNPKPENIEDYIKISPCEIE